jgi:hypothetical protein
MTIEAMKQALEALEYAGKDDFWRYQNEAIKSLRQAIAEAEKQEPVAWADYGVLNWIADMQFKHASYLYTHPQPKREWVGLTDEDLANCDTEEYKTARYWEAKLKEKNT